MSFMQDHLAVKHVMQSGQAFCMLSLQSCRCVNGFRISLRRTSLIAAEVDFKALLYCPTTAPKEIRRLCEPASVQFLKPVQWCLRMVLKQRRCRKLLQQPIHASSSSDTVTLLLSLLPAWCQDMFDMGKMSQRFSIRLYVRRPAGHFTWLLDLLPSSSKTNRFDGVSTMPAVNAGCSSKSSTTSSPSGWVL